MMATTTTTTTTWMATGQPRHSVELTAVVVVVVHVESLHMRAELSADCHSTQNAKQLRVHIAVECFTYELALWAKSSALWELGE